MTRVFAALYLLYASLIFVTLMFITLPFFLLFTGIFPKLKGKKIGLFCLRCWAHLFSSLSFFWMRTKHMDRIDTTKPHIYVGNHGSYLDAVAICISMPQFFSPLGKIEMAKIPVFGWIYTRIVVMIDRSSKESREASVLSLKEDIAEGQSILIFPEGTMNKTNKPLNDFYDGAFRLAIETQTPIAPFVLINSKELLPRVNPLKARPGIITTILLSPIKVEGLTQNELPELKQKVFNAMEQALLQYS